MMDFQEAGEAEAIALAYTITGLNRQLADCVERAGARSAVREVLLDAALALAAANAMLDTEAGLVRMLTNIDLRVLRAVDERPGAIADVIAYATHYPDDVTQSALAYLERHECVRSTTIARTSATTWRATPIGVLQLYAADRPSTARSSSSSTSPGVRP